MSLLVAGAARVDAGKPTLSTGLLARVGGGGFEPQAGNDHGDAQRSLAEGRLYGTDACEAACDAMLAAATD